MEKNNFRFEMGKRIKGARKAHNYTQEKMAEKLDISIKHYGDIERGNAGVSLETLLDISNILDISLDHLVKGTGIDVNYIPQKLIDTYLNLSNKEKLAFLRIIDELRNLK